MLRKKILPAMAVAVVVLFTACSKTNKQGLSIPQDAILVAHMNGEAISSKLSWEEINKNETLQKEMMADSTLPAYLKALVKDPATSGINQKSDIVMFMIADSTGGYFALTGAIADAKKFQTFNTELTEGGATVEKDGLSFITKAPLCISWNKEKFIYVFDSKDLKRMGKGSYDLNEDEENNASAISDRDLTATCKNLFALKESSSLAKNEKFSALMNDKADMHFWVNAENIGKLTGGVTAMAMLNLDKLTKGNISTMSVTFNDGKIDVKSKWYASKELSDIIKKYKGGSISEDMLKRLPAQKLPAVLALNFKPEGIREIVKLTGMDGLLNIGLMSAGFSMDDFINANKGDLLVALTKFEISNDSVKYNLGDKEYAYPSRDPKMDFIFAASIKEKDAFNKLIKAGQKAGKGGYKYDEGEEGATKEPEMAFSVNDKYFVMGSSKQVADAFLTGSSNNADVAKMLGSQPVGGYADIQMLMKATEQQALAGDSISKELFLLSQKMWDNVVLKGGDIEDGALTMNFEINLLDKKTNSLKQINTYSAALAALQQKRKAAYAMDDVQFTPPVIVPDSKTNSSKTADAETAPVEAAPKK